MPDLRTRVRKELCKHCLHIEPIITRGNSIGKCSKWGIFVYPTSPSCDIFHDNLDTREILDDHRN